MFYRKLAVRKSDVKIGVEDKNGDGSLFYNLLTKGGDYEPTC